VREHDLGRAISMSAAGYCCCSACKREQERAPYGFRHRRKPSCELINTVDLLRYPAVEILCMPVCFFIKILG
jgi:hypothetical protein